ncbi:MAG: hypothetical protein KDA28_12750, partial [Phycisphaerales bacterium]|nr:hypothetical protein [Phycisphaerales bacterium]
MWWTEQGAGLIGGLGGASIGVLGAMLGTTMGVLIPKGRAKRLVLSTLVGAIALGALIFGVGVVALATGQPYHVFYPLLLGGGLLTFIMTGLLPVAVMQYEIAFARLADGVPPGADGMMQRSPGTLRVIGEMWGPDGWLRRRVRP